MIMRVVVLALTLLSVSAPVHADTEVQGWRTTNDHIHTSVPLDMLATISAPTPINVTTLLHNRVGGTLTFVRWSDQSGIRQVVKMSVTGTGESEQRVVTPLTIDPALIPTSGYTEIRVTSNFVASDGSREFTTTRLCLNIVNGKTRKDYCGGPTVAGRCGGGAWYTATDYSVATVDCRDIKTTQTRPLVAGDTIRVKAQSGSLMVNLDPAFHVGNPGTSLLAGGVKGTWHKVTIPTGLTPGVHKLHVRDQRTNGEAGAYVLTFTVG